MNARISRIGKSFMGLPNWVKIWVMMILMPVNMAPFFFLNTEIGLWSAVAFSVVCAVNMPTMIIQGGLTRLLSFPHFIWIVLLIFLYPYLFGAGALDSDDPIYILGMSLFVVNIISLLFDSLEAYRWLRGEREILGIAA